MGVKQRRRKKGLSEAAAPALEPLLNAAQVASFLGVSVKSVYMLANEGSIPSIRIGNHRKSLLRFRREQLEKSLDEKAKKSAADKIES